MATLSPRVWWVAAALLLWSPHVQCRELTNEDIPTAMVSLFHTLRRIEDKLDRHEYREKSVAEQLKRSMGGLDKKHKNLEPLKNMISRLDERLSNVETILLQKEEREKKAQKDSNEVLVGIQKSLQDVTTAVKENSTPSKPTELDNNLTTNEDTWDRRLDITDEKMDMLKMDIQSLKASLSKDALKAICPETNAKTNPFEKYISEANKLLNGYELKLHEYNVTVNKLQTDANALNEVSLADDAQRYNRINEVIERQEKDLNKIQRLLSDAESMWKDLPRRSDMILAYNQTMDAVVNATENMKENTEASVQKVTTKLQEMSDRLATTNEDIQASLTQGNTFTESAYHDLSVNYGKLQTEVLKLTNNDKLLIETADNVLHMKRRIDYAVQQISLHVSELVTKQGKVVKDTLTDKFNGIKTAIENNQKGVMSNVSTSIEAEMSQVWRQIGIMHQQLMTTKQVLDKLSEDTQQYVNSSTSTMSKVKTEVGVVNTQLAGLSDNMNYVLGKLSLAMQEFREITTGLIDVVTGTNKKTTPVPSSKEAEPGPHVINSSEKSIL